MEKQKLMNLATSVQRTNEAKVSVTTRLAGNLTETPVQWKFI